MSHGKRLLIFGGALAALVVGVIWWLDRPEASNEARAPKVQLVHREDILVSWLPLPDSLAGTTVDSIAAGDLDIVVVGNGSAYLGSSGERLGGNQIRSVAVTSEGIVLLTDDAYLGELVDGKVKKRIPLHDATLRMHASPHAGADVFVFGGAKMPGLIRISTSGATLLVEEPVTAVGNTPTGVLFAVGRRIEKIMQSNGLRGTVLVMPDGEEPIISVAELAGRVVFSTRDSIWEFDGKEAAVLAEGIGGPLFAFRDGAAVLDVRSGRILLLRGKAFRSSEESG